MIRTTSAIVYHKMQDNGRADGMTTLYKLQHPMRCDHCNAWTRHARVLCGSDRNHHVCLSCGETTCTVYGDESNPLPSWKYPSVMLLEYDGRAPVCVLEMPVANVAQEEMFA